MDRELFQSIVASLKAANIPFWVDSGTLLGLIRNGEIIPWDEDYDFGVWAHAVKVESIIKIFDAINYKVKPLFAYGTHGIHIYPLDKRIKGKADIVFYTRQKDRAVHYSCAPKQNLWTATLNSVERFIDPEIEANAFYKRAAEKFFFRMLSPATPEFIKKRCYAAFNYLVARNHRNGKSLIYDFPARYFETFRNTNFLDIEVPIPADAEGYLASAYGSDWRTPIRWQHWWTAATFIDGQRNEYRGK